MSTYSQDFIAWLQNFAVRFRKQLAVPEPDPVGILLPGILYMYVFAALDYKTPLMIFFPWILWKKKSLGNSNCKSWCAALVALLGKKQK